MLLFLFRALSSIALLVLVSGCANKQAVVYDEYGPVKYDEWAESYQDKAFYGRNLVSVNQFSASLFLANESETKHLHKNHDLYLVLLKGKATVHLYENAFELKPGDSIYIRRSAPHWIEQVGNETAVFNIITSLIPWDNDQIELD
ncbi:cupin domain-containing protein [Agaribacterium sp. ZY112]|uniref:cupin domain-containing protein n=1 Tax=Agaribacterium sp. ZY112 TaxID=3233574 RepID=UPI003524C249